MVLSDKLAGRRLTLQDNATRALATRSNVWFTTFAFIFRLSMKRGFHSVLLADAVPPPSPDTSRLVIYTNHASWWDACVYVFIMRTLYPTRVMRTPIDAAMLTKYPFMARIGMFGVDQTRARGAADFLAVCRVVFTDAVNVLMISAQGRFADVRECPLRLQPGIAHLPDLADGIIFVPLAIEYSFWQEKRPELLLRFGATIAGDALKPASNTERLQTLATALDGTMTALATDSIARNAAAFTPILAGARGVNLFYDLWRRLGAWAAGRRFRPEHGAPP